MKIIATDPDGSERVVSRDLDDPTARMILDALYEQDTATEYRFAPDNYKLKGAKK